MNKQDFERKLTAVLSADGVDRFHPVFTDKDRGILLGHVLQPGFYTILMVESHL